MENNSIKPIAEDRLAVIANIARAAEEGDSFRKVELSDPIITDEDIKRVIVPFDNLRRTLPSKLRAFGARMLAQMMTAKFNKDTEIVGLENALAVKGGAIMTANHYNYTDSTPPRLVAYAMGKTRRFHIVIQQTNVFMPGLFGFLMKNANTMPVSPSTEYMNKNFTPALKTVLDRGDLVLIYPEQEMWFNYKKPRKYRDGAFHFAAQMGVPVIPTFTEMRNYEGEYEDNGFLKVKHIIHVMPPIYPDPNLSVRENRMNMMKKEYEMRRELYERVYGIPLTDDFDPERDIAGYHE